LTLSAITRGLVPPNPALISLAPAAHKEAGHKAQRLGYMKLLDVPRGLLINFHEMKVTDGISRLILP